MGEHEARCPGGSPLHLPSALSSLCLELILLLLLLEHMVLCFQCQGDFLNRMHMLLAFLVPCPEAIYSG